MGKDKKELVWVANITGGKQIDPRGLKNKKPISRGWKIATWVLMILFLILILGFWILMILS